MRKEKIVKTRLDEVTYNRFIEYCKELHLKPSQVLRCAVYDLIKKDEKDKIYKKYF